MTYLLPFIAGLLTTLSPCVLPVLPFVSASSLSKNRLGPLALALGLLITFVGISVLLNLSGTIFGIDPETIKKISGAFLSLSGLLFLFHGLQERLAVFLSRWTGGFSKASNRNFGGPLLTEFVSGLFLGVVWTPCSGPSLGAALGLAGNAANASKAAVILAVFGLGAVVPLLFFAYGARELILKLKAHPNAILGFEKVFGVLMIVFGISIMIGFDRNIEAVLTDLLPQGWIRFVTHF